MAEFGWLRMLHTYVRRGSDRNFLETENKIGLHIYHFHGAKAAASQDFTCGTRAELLSRFRFFTENLKKHFLLYKFSQKSYIIFKKLGLSLLLL